MRFLIPRNADKPIVNAQAAKTDDDFCVAYDNEELHNVLIEYSSGCKRRTHYIKTALGYRAMGGINREWAAFCITADTENILTYEENLSECE